MPADPYTDPVTGILRNNLGLSKAADLEAAEREITHAALVLLRESPVPPTYDLSHLRPVPPVRYSPQGLRRRLRLGRPGPDGGHR